MLPGNQTRCSGVLCRILKRYLFVRGCHPPPPAPLRSPLISSPLPPPPPLLHPPYPSQQASSISVQICLSPLKRRLLYRRREGSGIAPLLTCYYNQDDALSASTELASLLLILFFPRAALQSKTENVVALKLNCNERLLLCSPRTAIR